MTTLRNIWADLVEKRLWPVAIVLAAGLLAVPLVLAKGGDKPVKLPAGGAAIAASAGDDTEIVTLDVAPKVRRHDGHGRDPFVQPKSSDPEKAQALTSSTTDSGGGSGGGDTAGGTDTSSGDQAPAETKSSKPKSTGPTYTVDLRFGQADSMKTLRDVSRLTPLPSASSPFFVYLGAKGGGKTLVFLVSSDAKATGDGTCKPSKSACETIELQAGDTEFFDLTTTDGVQQYQMDIVKITKSGSASKSSTGKVASRASKADRRLLRKVLAGRASHLMGSYRWDAKRGVLVHVPAWDRDDAAPTGGEDSTQAVPYVGTGSD